MGARLTCSCPEAYCYGPQPYRLRIHAELFELSADGLRWQLVEPRLLYVTVASREDGASVIKATSQTGRTVLDTVIAQGQRVEKISDCFVFWKEATRTIGVNTLSAKDSDAFLSAVSSPTPPPAMLQHNTMAEVSEYAVWNTTKELILREDSFHPTMVSVNPLSLVFHHNHGLVHIDLLECCAFVADNNSFFVASSGRIFLFRVSGENTAVGMVKQMLNMSSLLLARTTSTEVALSYLQRQAAKNEEKMAMAKSQPGGEYLVDWLSLRRLLIQQRVAALSGSHFEVSREHLPSSPRAALLPDCPLPSCFVVYHQLHGFKMWRKSEAGDRESDLRALVTNDAVMGCPSSSSQTVVPILLPNGRTVAISHTSQEPKELLEKVCSKLAVQPDAFELRRLEDGFRLLLREEYEVVKKEGKLGLTIYAHNEKGVVRAEVRGVAAFAPEMAAVGDAVIAVDGKAINQVSSAADVERLLREGRVIRLRRRGNRESKSNSEKSTMEKTKTVAITPPPSDSRAKMEEKMVRGIEELVQTEKKYVEDLTEMLDRFLVNKVICDIMDAAPRLQKVQTTFLEAMLEAAGDISTKNKPTRVQIRDAVLRVSALFVNRCGELKVYAEYVAGYLRLQRELQSSKELLAFLEAANSTGEQHCNYESRMIRPVQRLVQYPLLLKAILGGCEPESMEAKQVDAAQQKMQTLAEYVNEMQRVHEQFAPHLDTVRKAHHQMIHHKGLRLDIRDLLIFAHIQWGSGDRAVGIDYVIFVFQTLVLLLPARVRGEIKTKWTRVMPINEVEVEETKGGETTIVLTHAAFRAPNGDLSHGNPDSVYYLVCCQSLLKTQILKSIRKARSNFAKEGRRPLSGSSQSDGGYGSDPSKERN